MKRKIFLLAFFTCTVLIFTTCKKETVEREVTPSIVEGEGIIIVKEQKIVELSSTYVLEVTTTDTVRINDKDFPVYEIPIEGTIEEIEQIEPGTVIYVPSGEKGGIVVFVYEVENGVKSGRLKGAIGAIIKGVQTTLDMYFNYEHATLSFTTPENRSKRNSTIANKLYGETTSWGETDTSFVAEMPGVKIESGSGKLFKASLSSTLWSSGSSHIKVTGSLSVDPAVDLFVEYEPKNVKNGSNSHNEVLAWLEAALVPDVVLFLYKDKNFYLGNMKQLRANIYMDIDKELTFNIHLEKEFAETVEIPMGTLTVPSIPVSAQFEMSFEIDFSALGALDFEAYTNEQNDVVVGVNLDRDLPEPVWYYESNQEEDSGYKLKAEIALTAGIKLLLETEVYVLGVLGPEFTAEAFLEATASVNAIAGSDNPAALEWKLKAKAGLRGNATLNLSAFHIDKGTWKMWIMAEKEWKEEVYSAPETLKIEQGNGQTGIMGQPLQSPITIGAYDSRDKLITYLPVPVYFEAQDGSSAPSGLAWTNGGLASTYWTLGSNSETQILNAYLKENSTKKGEIEVTASATDNGSDYGTFTDPRDGHVYKTVTIGTQTWMAENLAYLPSVSGPSSGSFTSPLYYVHGYNGSDVTAAKATDNYQTYGALYNWPAAKVSCPAGWHLPNDTEWTEFTDYLTDNGYGYGGSGSYIGKSMASTSGWKTYSTAGRVGNDQASNNSSGFTALPGGERYHNGNFSPIGNHARWWSSSEYSSHGGYTRYLVYDSSGVHGHAFGRSYGFSVRCLRD
jgi:uncharacterized protein (TIGR02145 family)